VPIDPPRTARRAIAVALLAIAAGGPTAAGQGGAPPSSLFDPRLADLRRASVSWENREGPRRQVVDLVCLVPDLPSYYAAIAAWDESHYFPVLFDDPELSLKFLRAFRPARVVRLPSTIKPAAADGPDAAWATATAAVGQSWTAADDPGAAPPGDRPPKGLGPTPPGLVLSSPGAPMLAGAVALAAGRFQPLLRWEPGRTAKEAPNEDVAVELAGQVEELARSVTTDYDRLGDGLDFITLAGDTPWKYDAKRLAAQPGTASFDDLVGRDLVGRSGPLRRRWAYAGRLTGDAAASAYRAMCSLFLRPRTALLFNGYSETGDGWKDYAMRTAATRLKADLQVKQVAAPAGADLAAWHAAFDPLNRAGLVLINSSGNPDTFNVPGGPGHAADVPPTMPAAVAMIHSFSAAKPDDPDTIAGRWLANGAFLYFGSISEPYLDAFRRPALVADLLAEQLPTSAALRQLPEESPPFGNPWRLTLLGDPLYQPITGPPAPRLADWKPVAAWPSYRAAPAPAEGAEPFAKLSWALRQAIVGAGSRADRGATAGALAAMLALPRSRLAPNHRPLYDALLADLSAEAGRPDQFRRQLAAVAAEDLSPSTRRRLQSARLAALHRSLAAADWPAALNTWDELIRSGLPGDFPTLVTARVGAIATGPTRPTDWRRRLDRARESATEGSPVAAAIDAERKRLAPAPAEAVPPRRRR